MRPKLPASAASASATARAKAHPGPGSHAAASDQPPARLTMDTASFIVGAIAGSFCTVLVIIILVIVGSKGRLPLP
jgi:hypothetical protein